MNGPFPYRKGQRIALTNAAIMPEDGIYHRQRLSKDEFAKRMCFAKKHCQIASYIGYAETAEFIHNTTGIDVPVNRSNTELESGDVMLVVKLPYRVAPENKGKTIADRRDFEFFEVSYQR